MKKDNKIIPFKTGFTPIKPPAHLNAKEAALFKQVVESCSHRQFVETDVHLLASFVQCTLVARESVKDLPDSAAMWDKAVKLQATLATKLRLTPQSRFDQRAAARRARESATSEKPWDE